MVTQKQLKDQLDYDPCTGVFKRKKNRGKAKIGDVAGGINNKGYVYIRVFSVKYRAHRLAWLYVYGDFPKNQIDHINRIKTDNRIANLRDVTMSVNQRNRNLQANNTSGHVGVRWQKQAKCWRVNIADVHYGHFKSKAAAIEKAKSVYDSLGYHKDHGKVAII